MSPKQVGKHVFIKVPEFTEKSCKSFNNAIDAETFGPNKHTEAGSPEMRYTLRALPSERHEA